ncbi:hypothetical protein [Sabulibacter ruber]|uniref:hypothetical protein n=1 Tax=Sabulibacter ruber TaxID=2811901 RepID=UPI001A969FF9|nr:hypothetical protein [Sabulibacter ruber]
MLVKALTEEDTPVAEVEILKSFGESNLSGKIDINGFYMLDLTSSSGHGLHLPFEKDNLYYLFLKKNEKGGYSLPTPTSGYAKVEDGNVSATYRHSYHQALLPQEIYEQTFTEIWSFFKTGKYNESAVVNFINANLSKAPAGFGENEIATFFLQHAALETAYLLNRKVELSTLKKFVETDNFHSTVSALRLLGNNNSKEVATYLLQFISQKDKDNFTKVIAIKALWATGDTEHQQKLLSMKGKLSEKSEGFGGNIMDPRVGTHFPSPRQAVEELSKQ